MSVFDNLLGAVKNSLHDVLVDILKDLSTGNDDRDFASNHVSVNTLAFDLTTSESVGEGQMTWNAEDGTLDVGMPGGNVTLQLNEETVLRATNKSGIDISNGDAVYVSGGLGSRATIAKADADSLITSGVIGVATEGIDDNASGYVTTFGLVRDIDTSGAVAGQVFWLSQTSGELTTTRPSAPATSVVVGVCIFSSSDSGVMLVKVQLVPRIVGLSDVSITSLADGNILVYDSASTTWKNQAP